MVDSCQSNNHKSKCEIVTPAVLREEIIRHRGWEWETRLQRFHTGGGRLGQCGGLKGGQTGWRGDREREKKLGWGRQNLQGLADLKSS